VHDRLSEQIATLPSLNKAQLLSIGRGFFLEAGFGVFAGGFGKNAWLMMVF
jgi:hypothetical protein